MTITDSNRLIYTLLNNELIVGTNTDNLDDNKNALPSTNPPTRIILPECVQTYKVTKIGISAFRQSNIKSAFISATITTIGTDAFAYCYSLKEVRFSEASVLTTLYQGVFYDCPKLKEIRIPPTVNSIDLLVFGRSNFDAIYYCGDAVFSSDINIFGDPDNDNRYYPKKIFVRETYSAEKFGDCTNMQKTNICSVPIHEPTRCTINGHARHNQRNLIIKIYDII